MKKEKRARAHVAVETESCLQHTFFPLDVSGTLPEKERATE